MHKSHYNQQDLKYLNDLFIKTQLQKIKLETIIEAIDFIEKVIWFRLILFKNKIYILFLILSNFKIKE